MSTVNVLDMFKKLMYAEVGSTINFSYLSQTEGLGSKDNRIKYTSECEVLEKRIEKGEDLFNLVFELELEDLEDESEIEIKAVAYSNGGRTIQINVDDVRIFHQSFDSFSPLETKLGKIVDFNVYTRPEVELDLFARFYRATRMVRGHYKKIFNINDDIGRYNIIYNVYTKFKGSRKEKDTINYFDLHTGLKETDVKEAIQRFGKIEKRMLGYIEDIDDDQAYEAMKRFLDLDNIVGMLMWRTLDDTEKRRYKYLDGYLSKYKNRPLYLREYKRFF